MRRLTPPDAPALLVGTETGDDAAVWRLDDARAIVATADFITPVVDDARTWGRVAAANAVSDVFAMGGRPLFSLNLVGWNLDALGTDLLGEVLAGGDDVARAAGFVVAGGHTVDDPEPKYGMAVIGEIDPGRIMTNAGLTAGQALVLTKPLGVGIVTTAIKADRAPDAVAEAAVASMIRLNDVAARTALAAGVTGCTDVTGFGLLGHLGRMAEESGVDVEVRVDDVPVLPGARDLAASGFVPGGTRRNLAHVAPRLDATRRHELDAIVLADAQTSGGLVFGVEPAHAREVVQTLARTGHTAAVIGTVGDGVGRMRLV